MLNRQKTDFPRVFAPSPRVRRVWVCLYLFLAIILCGPATADDAVPHLPSLAEIQVVTGLGEPKIRLFASDPIEISGTLVDGPNRLVVTLPPVRDRLVERKKSFETGPIVSYELIKSSSGSSKIEFVLKDLLAPVHISREPLANGAAYASTVVLRHIDRQEFTRLVKLSKLDQPLITDQAKSEPIRVIDHRPLIVIDPGHGGADTGAAGLGGVLEKDIVFAFSKALAKALDATGVAKARLTRETDQFIGLDKRVDIARAMGADYLISIHADTIAATTDVRGMTVYFGSDRPSDAEAARLAEKENKSDLMGGLVATKTDDAVANILGDLMMRDTRARSVGLAHSIIEKMTEASAINKNPVRSAAFRVLRAPDFPSILIELGYISSPSDISLLTSESWTAKAAERVASGLLDYLASQPLPTVKAADPG